MKNFIKIMNPDIAKVLAELGFNYTTEKLNNETVYCFSDDKSLREYLMKNYSSKDSFESNRLSF